MGVIEYGDADALDANQANLLLVALQKLAARNPRFRSSGAYSLKGLAHPSLIEPLRASINGTATEPELLLLLLEAVIGSSIVEALQPDLRRIGLDASATLSHRMRAIDALVAVDENWPAFLTQLQGRGFDDDIRLALEILAATGPGLYSDAEVIGVAVSSAQLDHSHSYTLTRVVEELDVERLDSLLDELIKQISALGNRHERRGNTELTDLGYRLIARRLSSGSVEAPQLWAWLRPFDTQYGYRREVRDEVHKLIRENAILRRACQRLVLLDEKGPKTVWERAYRLTSRSPGFSPTPEDVLILLALLDPAERDDSKWRDILRLIPHSATEGVEARELAKRLVANRADMLAWIDRLAESEVPEWKVKQEKEERRRASKRAMEWQEHRKNYGERIGAMREGDFAAIFGPAQAYLGLYHDMDEKAAPYERVAAWLGEELAKAAVAGFEAFLQSDSAPSAAQVAQSNGESQSWNATTIIVAALAERVRSEKGFADVSDDRIMVAYYDLRISRLQALGKAIDLRSAVEKEMEDRGLTEAALTAWIEPQLEHKRTHVDQLYQLMREPSRQGRAADFAIDWLTRYPDLAADPEAEMVDRLIASSRLDDLRTLTATRLGQALVDDRRRLWNAVAFIADFEAYRDRLATLANTDKAWLWSVRQRIGGDHGRRISPTLSVEQLAWLITTFRIAFPVVGHPSGIVTGDKNPWDASQFVTSVASRLADMVTTDAVSSLAGLVGAPLDSYSSYLRALAAEQQSKLTETRYRPPRLADVRAIIEMDPPRTVADLQATLLELIEQVQKRTRADSADSWRGFYADNGEPYGEERCRDYLLTMLGAYPEQIELRPEGHMAQDNRADIIALLRGMLLPVEIKGQWHGALWHAADTQLDRLYATDYGAERRGIYLVFWFGDQVPLSKALKSQGRGIPNPATPEELRDRLILASQAAQDGRIDIVVFDCTRPPRS